MKTIYDMPILLHGAELRKAQERDIPKISALTRGENLLFRSLREIRYLLHYYHVVEDIYTKEITGCIGAKIYDNDAEITSFILEERYRHIGIGRDLLRKQLGFLSSQIEISRIFVLTTREVAQSSFSTEGFVEVGIQLFKPKVLSDCANCRKNVFKNSKHLCNEIAMIYKRPPSQKG